MIHVKRKEKLGGLERLYVPRLVKGLMTTARHFQGDTLVIASHNAGKLGEFAALFEPLGVAVLSAAELDLAEVEESGTSFRANAKIKAQAAATASGSSAQAHSRQRLAARTRDRFTRGIVGQATSTSDPRVKR